MLLDATSIEMLRNAFPLETIVVTLIDAGIVTSTVTVNVDLEIWTGLEDRQDPEDDTLNLIHEIATEISR